MKFFAALSWVLFLTLISAAQSPTPSPSPGIHEEVTVNISADTEQTIEQVSKTVDVIDPQQMRDRADFALIESLRTIPGFHVQQSGGFGRLATVKTRGLRNSDTALLIDGIRFRDVATITGDASSFISDFTLTSVSQIEVLRGSGSSLYGTNAIGGAVDLQTPEAPGGTHGQVGVNGGGLGFGRFRGNLSHGIPREIRHRRRRFATILHKGNRRRRWRYNYEFTNTRRQQPFSKTNLSGGYFFPTPTSA